MHLLGSPLVLFENGEVLRERILESSVVLFAMEGFETVSMQQVVQCSGVSSRQIYKLYKDKADLLCAILNKCGEMLSHFYTALRGECVQAPTFREVVDLIFVELIDITNEFTYFGLCVAHQLQYSNKQARKIYGQVFLGEGVETLKYVFDQAVERKLCPSFDTKAAASLISSSVVVANDIRAGQLAGYRQAIDLKEWYTAQANLIVQMIPGLEQEGRQAGE